MNGDYLEYYGFRFKMVACLLNLSYYCGYLAPDVFARKNTFGRVPQI